jgi:hypothetical protein
MVVFSYWRAVPPAKTDLEQLAVELEGLQLRWPEDMMLLVRD